MIETFEYLQHFQRPVEIFKEHVNTGLAGLTIRGLLNAYATSEIIRFAFLLTDESLTSLAKKVPDLLDYSDSNALINFENDIDEQLYNLFHINEKNQLYVRNILFQKSKL